MKSILIAVDGSIGSDVAVDEGLELARQTGASVTLVFVRQPPLPLLGDPYYQRAVTGELEHAEEALRRASERARVAGVEVETEMLEGEPARVIVDLARSRDVDIVVVGSRGLGTVAGSLLGSVSRAVVHDADRPVLVVPQSAAREAPATVKVA
jgi:nucleotide-binding universal stress UspA family protein